MATEILRPNGVGAQTDIYHQRPATGQHWDKVDETVVDYITTAVYSKWFGPPDPPVPTVP